MAIVKADSHAPEAALKGLGALAGAGPRKPAPVHLWNPPYCGDIDMRIAGDGVWFYQGSPIGRLPLVKLFASVLRRDGDKYFLVTPVERVGIRVDDAPFLAVEMSVAQAPGGRAISFRTNVDDEVTVGPEHPLRFEVAAAQGLKPYVLIRAGLWALVKRPLYYDLAALGEPRARDGEPWLGVASAGAFFPMAPMRELEGL